MKLPSNPAPAPPPTQGDRAAGSAPDAALPAASARPGAATARAELDQLQMASRESLLARVAALSGQQQGKAEQLVLEIRGRLLPVQASIGETRLQPGDWVKVMRAGNELQLLGKLAPAPEAGIARALAQRLPWQHSLDSGLARLATALSSGLRSDSPGLPGATQPLPQPVRQAIEQLFSRLPASSGFQPGAGNNNQVPAQVRQWVAESGLFSESRLSQTPQASLPDLKLALGRIATALLGQQGQGPQDFNRLTPLASPELVQAPLKFPVPLATTTAPSPEAPSAGQMLRLIAGMLNRISVNQLHSQVLSSRPGGEAAAPSPSLLLELPLLTTGNEPRIVQLRIDQEQTDSAAEDRQGKAAAAEWKLSLTMDLDATGALQFDVSLRHQQVSARVWAEKQATLRQVQQDLPELRRSLADLGLEVLDLDCRRGMPQGAATRLEHRLVDTRA